MSMLIRTKIDKTPLINVSKELYDWLKLVYNKVISMGGYVLLGYKTGEDKQILTHGMILKANGGCDDSHRIEGDIITMSVAQLSKYDITTAALCCMRECIPYDRGTVLINIANITELYEGFPFIVIAEDGNLVWCRKKDKLHKSMLGIINPVKRGGEKANGKEKSAR